MKYRADIDGLRAFAVLSVIFYHLGMTNILKSGYVGVDIFFIISGYLITSIIYTQMLTSSSTSLKGSFSLLDFYERRVRRILPVFFLVVLVTLLLGNTFLVDFFLNELTNSIFSVIAIGANFHFWGDQGYFAIESHFTPLLHMWSLAIEEQFYIFFPLLLGYLVRKSKPIIKILFSITIISFIACVVTSFISQKTAFYWLPFRGWELLLGSLLAIISVKAGQDTSLIKCTKKWQHNILSIFTIFLLLFSVTYLETLSSVFPSYIALIPCIASLLCIELGKNKESIIYKLLSLPILVGIGKISYSLYLWHWVIIVFIGNIIITNSFKLNFTQQIISFILTFILTLLSYYFLEQPIRKKKVLKTRKVLFSSMLMTATTLCILAYMVKEDIIPRFMESKYDTISIKSEHFSLPQNPIEGIANLYKFGNIAKEPTLFVTGDSHAQSTYSMLDYLAKENDVCGLIYISQAPLYNTLPANANLTLSEIENISAEHELVKEYVQAQNIKSTLFVVRWTLRMYGKTLVRDMLERPGFFTLHYINEDKTINENSEFAIMQAIKDAVNFWSDDSVDFYYLKNLPEFIIPVPVRAGQIDRLHKNVSIKDYILSDYSDYEKLHEKTFNNLEFLKTLNFHEISLTDKICDETYCYGLDENNIPRYVDNDHLSIQGAMEFREEFLPFILSGK